LDATFKKHDANGDGMLSLPEFTGIIKEVDKNEKRFPRPVSRIPDPSHPCALWISHFSFAKI
jgi:hypothetical protein